MSAADGAEIWPGRIGCSLLLTHVLLTNQRRRNRSQGLNYAKEVPRIPADTRRRTVGVLDHVPEKVR
jgi:hypothetical protein